MAMTDPAHPGEILREEILPAYGLTARTAAKALGVTSPALSRVLDGRARLSADLALRCEKALGVSMDLLLRIQTSRDIADARKRESEVTVARYAPAAGDAAESGPDSPASRARRATTLDEPR